MTFSQLFQNFSGFVINGDILFQHFTKKVYKVYFLVIPVLPPFNHAIIISIR